MIKIWLPSFCKDWLKTKPTEGDILVMAAISVFADALGSHVYQEWEGPDLKCLNWTYEDMQITRMLNRLEDAGLIETMRGIDYHESIRLSEVAMEKKRVVFGSDAIGVKVSSKSQIIWAYFLGRTADILERSHQDNIVAPLEVEKGLYKKPKPKTNRKHNTDKVIHHIYGYQLKNKNFKFNVNVNGEEE